MEAVHNQGEVTGSKPELRARVDDEGRLVFPPEVACRYGLRPGVQARIVEGMNGVHLRRPVTHLAKVYIEPTNCCNLECRICLRKSSFMILSENVAGFCPSSDL